MKYHKRQLIILILLISVVLTSCSISKKTERYVGSERFLFGTYCSIKIYYTNRNSKTIEKTIESVWNRMTEIENNISAKLPYSTVSKLNNGETVIPDEDTRQLLIIGTEFMKLTDGAFDIYLKSVSDLWGIGTDKAKIPSEEEIENALLEKKIDLGAIGKGYAAEVAKKMILEAGYTSAIINFGGNVCCVGSKPNGEDFAIGIRNPEGNSGTLSQTLHVSDCSVVTSGSYEKYLDYDGKRYSHIINPLTGFPAEPDFKSVTVVGPDSCICDALSTSVFVMGKERGTTLLANFPDYYVIFN